MQTTPFLDTFIEGHFQAWVKRYIPQGEREKVDAGIRSYLAKHPTPLERGDGWPDIHSLAKREGFIK